jgi:protocatechuate 3,4-dioxygenase beta subunit
MDEGRLFTRAAVLNFMGVTLLSAGSAAARNIVSECAPTPEGEIGPYFADDSVVRFKRSNILSNIDGTAMQQGVPLTLTIAVLDTRASCAPVSRVQIDLWHCNASGVYSDEDVEGTGDQTWLRGYQVTGSSGAVTFKTIVPGWYEGRATHIHVRARSKYNNTASPNDGSNTTQLFFPQRLVDSLYTSVEPYRRRGRNPMTNANDNVYATQTSGRTELVLKGTPATGYVTSYMIALPVI